MEGSKLEEAGDPRLPSPRLMHAMRRAAKIAAASQGSFPGSIGDADDVLQDLLVWYLEKILPKSEQSAGAAGGAVRFVPEQCIWLVDREAHRIAQRLNRENGFMRSKPKGWSEGPHLRAPCETTVSIEEANAKKCGVHSRDDAPHGLSIADPSALGVSGLDSDQREAKLKADRIALLRELTRRLPAREARAVEMRLEGRRLREIAAEFGCTESMANRIVGIAARALSEMSGVAKLS